MNLKYQIKNLLKETIEQKEMVVYKPCSRFDLEKYKLTTCINILKLGPWLVSEDGLGLSNIIEEILDEYGTNVPEKKINEYKIATDFLQKMGKVNQKFVDIFYDEIVKNRKFVLINDKWSPVNKLNTNRNDLAELLTDLLFKSPKASPIVKKLFKQPKETLDDIKPHLKELLQKYFKGPDKFAEYTKNIESNSKQGQDGEDEVRKVLEEKGFEILYQGGDGDLIDMIFGVDLIVKSPTVNTKQYKLNTKSLHGKEIKITDLLTGL